MQRLLRSAGALKKVFGRLSVRIADRGSRQIRGDNTRLAESESDGSLYGCLSFFSYPKITGIRLLCSGNPARVPNQLVDVK